MKGKKLSSGPISGERQNLGGGNGPEFDSQTATNIFVWQNVSLERDRFIFCQIWPEN